jgi:hypothetical protein
MTMLTFSEMLSALPQIEDEAPGIAKYLSKAVVVSFAVGAALVGAGMYWNKASLVYMACGPIVLVLMGMALDAVLEYRSIAEMVQEPGGWLSAELDQRFAREKQLAAELAKSDLVELKRMYARLEAELVRVERALDVLKPIGMALPAIAILVAVGVLHLPGLVQEIVKLFAVAGTLGAMMGAMLLYKANVRLRTVSATLHYAISMAETVGKPSFRKVSKKRHNR